MPRVGDVCVRKGWERVRRAPARLPAPVEELVLGAARAARSVKGVRALDDGRVVDAALARAKELLLDGRVGDAAHAPGAVSAQLREGGEGTAQAEKGAERTSSGSESTVNATRALPSSGGGGRRVHAAASRAAMGVRASVKLRAWSAASTDR
eukprot:4059384-Prymnesium_polylepis.1